MTCKIYTSSILMIFLFSLNTVSQPTISFQQLATGLTSTVDVVNAGDGTHRLFIVEQAGRINIFKNGSLLTKPFLDCSSVLLANRGSEQGLLSITFHPDYATNRYFYIHYNNAAGDVTIARYRTSAINPDSAELSSGVVLLHVPKPFSNHNGGKLNFGADGYLYFAFGDGGGGGDPQNMAQRRDTLLGKMIRINANTSATPPYYTIPSDNPYIDSAGVKKEIWAMGLRNPWRWSFDRQTHDMWVADVGEGSREEVNFRPNGSTGGINYGWRCFEGNSIYNTSSYCGNAGNTIFPIYTYTHNITTGGYAITGGYVYRGSEFPDMMGYYIFSDYISGNGWVMNATTQATLRQAGWPQLSSFGEGEDGTLYALALNGTLYKVIGATSGPLPVNLLSFTASKQNSLSLIKWLTANEVNTRQFEVEKSTDGITFKTIAVIAASHAPVYNYTDDISSDNTPVFYRLKIADNNGRSTYSNIVKIMSRGQYGKMIYPNVIKNNMLNIYSDVPLKSMQLVNVSGNILMTKQLNSNQSNYNIVLPALPAGVYFVKVFGNNNTNTERIVVQ